MATITKTSCNSVDISDVADFSLKIYQLKDDGSFTEIYDHVVVVTVGTTISYTFAADGVYYYEFTDAGLTVTRTNTVIYCAIKTCMLEFIQKLICTDGATDKTRYYYTGLMTAHYTFQMLINLDFIDNWSYTTLEQHQLNDMLAISKVMSKMTEYCTALNMTESSENCGCS